MKTTTTLFTLLIALFSFSAFSQTTHSLTYTPDMIWEPLDTSITVQSGDVVELINGASYGTYAVRTSHDGVNFTQIAQSGPYYPGVIFDTLIEQSDINFYLRVENQFGMPMLTVNVTIDNNTASILLADNEIKYNVYPNPFVDYINIDGFVEEVSVLDLNGKLIFSDTPNSFNTKIDLSHLEAGIYIVQVNDTHRLKVVKE